MIQMIEHFTLLDHILLYPANIINFYITKNSCRIRFVPCEQKETGIIDYQHNEFVALLLGIEKKNLLPFPDSLSTPIRPPCLSTNSLQSNNPKPVPFSFWVPNVE
jgi:hypothetical protein